MAARGLIDPTTNRPYSDFRGYTKHLHNALLYLHQMYGANNVSGRSIMPWPQFDVKTQYFLHQVGHEMGRHGAITNSVGLREWI